MAEPQLEAPAEEMIFKERVRPSKGDLYSYLASDDCRGNLSKAAREFGVLRRTITEMVHGTPELMSLVEELREGHIDRAEENIFADVAKGDAGSSRFVAQTLGKSRGWAMGTDLTSKNQAIGVEIVRFTEGPDNGQNKD